MDNPFGGLAGLCSNAAQRQSFGPKLSQGQFLEAQKQAAMIGSGVGLMSNNSFNTPAADFSNTSITIVPPVAKKPILTGITEYGYDLETGETALAWLDRRVGEMRVAL